MSRRKKGSDFNRFIVIAAIVVFAWIGADYYFNVYQHPRTEAPAKDAPVPAVVEPDAPIPAAEEVAPALEDGFRLETYRDENNKYEFQYPVYAQADPQCPAIEKTDNGINLGIFSFMVFTGEGQLSNFIDKQLEGMDIEKNEAVTVSGQAAAKVDYQTKGMGWSASEVFLARNGSFYEFGILANTSSEKCGGVDDYADRVYRSVITTLEFTE